MSLFCIVLFIIWTLKINYASIGVTVLMYISNSLLANILLP